MGLVTLGIVIVLFAFVGGLTTFHHIALVTERGRLDNNPGQLVTVNGNRMNVYIRGEQQGNDPTLIFISGAGTAAPIYNFMPLLNRLPNYRLVVVERFGYGYSDIVRGLDRDISSMLSDTRKALILANIELENLILLPHSMGGLEALYWANQHPDEIKAIIGLDMAVPDSYNYLDFDSEKSQIMMARGLKFFGLSRLMGNTQGTADLTNHQRRQQNALGHRNFVNPSLVAEGLALLDNIEIVRENSDTSVPMLMFSSHGKDIDDNWVPTQEAFANERANRQLIVKHAGHYIHQYHVVENIANEIIAFVGGLL